jgi:hypothetical protein
MKTQRNQIIALLALIILTGVSWRINRIPPTPPSIIKTKAAKVVVGDSLLKTRFHNVRAKMDLLYHYRVKPVAFNPAGNPFRIPGVRETAADTVADTKPKDFGPPPPGYAEHLLKQAVAAARIGGVVVMNGATRITINGKLHTEGDVFTSKINGKLVLVKIKKLAADQVILALDGSDAGSAETKLHIK